MKRIAFVGPSLPVADRSRFSGRIELRAPARKGDLLLAASDGAAVIGLADGLFENSPSVWHKEILYCLARGIVVAGGASMGALRAAECDRFGMIGIGAIYEDYRSGRRNADADVAVLHAPAELAHAALTVALADVDATLDAMAANGQATAEEHAALHEAARRLNFRDRSWKALILEAGKGGACGEDLGARVRANIVARKRQDCMELLEYVARVEPGMVPRPAFDLQPSAFLTGLLQQLDPSPQRR